MLCIYEILKKSPNNIVLHEKDHTIFVATSVQECEKLTQRYKTKLKENEGKMSLDSGRPTEILK